jgi:ribonuclease HI
MYFDGAYSREGNGVGVIFISLGGKTFKYSFLLTVECTSNIAKYEALLLGLNMAIRYGIKTLPIYGDSELVIS